MVCNSSILLLNLKNGTETRPYLGGEAYLVADKLKALALVDCFMIGHDHFLLNFLQSLPVLRCALWEGSFAGQGRCLMQVTYSSKYKVT